MGRPSPREFLPLSNFPHLPPVTTNYSTLSISGLSTPQLAPLSFTESYISIPSTFSLLAEPQTCTVAPRSSLLLLLWSRLPNGLLQFRLLEWVGVELRTTRLCPSFQINLAALMTHSAALGASATLPMQMGCRGDVSCSQGQNCKAARHVSRWGTCVARTIVHTSRTKTVTLQDAGGSI